MFKRILAGVVTASMAINLCSVFSPTALAAEEPLVGETSESTNIIYDYSSLPTYKPEADNLGYFDIPAETVEKINTNVTGASVTRAEFMDTYPEANITHAGEASSFNSFDPNADVYYITSLADLEAFRDLVNNGNDFAGKTVILTNDIDLQGVSWVPIGKFEFSNSAYYTSEYDEYIIEYLNGCDGYTKPFNGTFDGGNHKILNMHLVDETANFIGFFGYVGNEAMIKNLHIVDAELQGYNYVGGIAGFVRRADFVNCSFSGSAKGLRYVGGIIGMQIYGSHDHEVNLDAINNDKYMSSMTDCVLHMDSNDKMASIMGGYCVGGLCGYAGQIKITMTVNTAIKADVKGYMAVGGIAGGLGANDAVIFNRYDGEYDAWKVLPSKKLKDYSSGDGLLDAFWSTLSYDVSNITVLGSIEHIEDISTFTSRRFNEKKESLYKNEDTTHPGRYIGGVVGLTGYIDRKDQLSKIQEKVDYTDFYNYTFPRRIHSIYVDADIKGNEYIGSIGGYFTGDMYDINASSSNIQVDKNSSYVGTLAGWFDGNYERSAHSITVREMNLSGGSYLGGLFGFGSANFGYTINYRYDLGGSNSYEPEYRLTLRNISIPDNITVSGKNYVGGLMGYSRGLYDISTAFPTNKFNVNVTGDDFVGGVAGCNFAPCIYYGDVFVDRRYEFNEIIMTGNITGKKNVGGFFGYWMGSEYNRMINAVTDEDTGGSNVTKVGTVILDCTNKATVQGTKNVGGIAGTFATASDRLEEPCDVYSSMVNTKVGYGYTYYEYTTMDRAFDTRAYIEDCTNMGDIKAENANVGGIVGLNCLAVICNSYNARNIECASANHVGGIVGCSDSAGYKNVSDHYALASGSAWEWQYNWGVRISIGGHSLLMNETPPTDNHNDMTHSYRSSSVTNYRADDTLDWPKALVPSVTPNKTIHEADEYHTRTQLYALPDINYCRNDGVISGCDNVGGIAGSANDYIGVQVAYKTAVENRLHHVINNGKVIGNNNVGGIIGYATGRLGTNCARNLSDVEGKTNIGGIVGLADEMIAVSESFNIATVKGDTNIGGLVGLAESGDLDNVMDVVCNIGWTDLDDVAQYTSRNKMMISDSYNTGSIIGNAYAGGLVGYLNGDKTRTIQRFDNRNDEITWGYIMLDSCYNIGDISNITDPTINYFFSKAGPYVHISHCYIDEHITTATEALGEVNENVSGSGDPYIDVLKNPFDSEYPIVSDYEFAMRFSGISTNKTWINVPKHQTKYGTLPSQRPLLRNNIEATAELYPLDIITEVVDYNSWRNFWMALYTNYTNYSAVAINPTAKGDSNYDYLGEIVYDPSNGVTTKLNWAPYDDNTEGITKDPLLRQMGAWGGPSKDLWFYMSNSYWDTKSYRGYAGILDGNNKTIAFKASQKEDEIERLKEDLFLGGDHFQPISGPYLQWEYLLDESGNVIVDSEGNPRPNPLFGSNIAKENKYVFGEIAPKGVAKNLTFKDGSPLGCYVTGSYGGASGGGINNGTLDNITVINRGLACINNGTIRNCNIVSPMNIGGWTIIESQIQYRAPSSPVSEYGSLDSYNTATGAFRGMLTNSDTSECTNRGIIENCIVENGSVLANTSYRSILTADRRNKGVIRNTYTINAPLIYGTFATGTIENCFSVNALYLINTIDPSYEMYITIANSFLYTTDDFDKMIRKSFEGRINESQLNSYDLTPKFSRNLRIPNTLTHNGYFFDLTKEPVDENNPSAYRQGYMTNPDDVYEGRILNCFVNNPTASRQEIIVKYPIYKDNNKVGETDLVLHTIDNVTNDDFESGAVAYSLYMFNKDVIGTPDEENFWGQFIAEDSRLENAKLNSDAYPVLNLLDNPASDKTEHPRVHKIEFDWTEYASKQNNSNESAPDKLITSGSSSRAAENNIALLSLTDPLPENSDKLIIKYMTKGRRLVPPTNSEINANPDDRIIWTDTADNSVFTESLNIASDAHEVASVTNVMLLQYEAFDRQAKITQPTDTENGKIELWVDIAHKDDALSFTPETKIIGDTIIPTDAINIAQLDAGNKVTYVVSATNAANETVSKSYDLDLHWLGVTHYDIPSEDKTFEGEIDQNNNTITIHIPRTELPESIVAPNATGEGDMTKEDYDPENSDPIAVKVESPDEPPIKKTYEVTVIIDEDSPSVPDVPETPDVPDIPKNPEEPEVPDDTAIILEFEIGEYKGIVVQNDKDEVGTITLNIPDTEDINDAIPNIVWGGETLHPDDGEAQNFNNQLVYTVTAESGRQKSYDIIVNIIHSEPQEPEEPDDTATILEFAINDYEGTIEQNNDNEVGKITLNIPDTEDISNVIPDIIWKGDTLLPDESEAQNFNELLIYTVTAESGRQKSYEVIINIIHSEPEIPDTGIVMPFGIIAVVLSACGVLVGKRKGY